MEDIEKEETVLLKGSLKITNVGTREICRLVLSTPAMDLELTRGSFMHCSDIQQEITAED